jgi:hypothetical protein
MPFVKYRGEDEREVPDLRLVVQPNHTYEVTAEQMDGLICQTDLWEKTTATKSAPKTDATEADPDLAGANAEEGKA